ncbi:MAG: MFS transporter [Pseudomonadota bacterium]
MTVRLRGLPAFGMVLVSTAYVVEISTFPLILPALAESLNILVQSSQARMLVAFYKIALVISLLFGGWLGDRLGKEVIFTVGTAIFCLASFALLLSPNAEAALIARALQGFGAGLFSPMVPALLSAHSPQNPVRALARWGLVTGIAAATYPIFAEQLIRLFGWSGGWVVIPLVAGLSLFGLPRTKDVKDPPEPAKIHTSLRDISIPVWAILAYVFLNYGITTWFIYAMAINMPAGTGMYNIGLLMAVLWGTFSISNIAVEKLWNGWASGARLLVAGALLNTTGVWIFGAFGVQPICCVLAALLIGMGMALNNVPTTEMAFELSDRTMHGRVASLDIVAARLGGAVFVVWIPIVGWEGVIANTWAALISLMMVAYAASQHATYHQASQRA